MCSNLDMLKTGLPADRAAIDPTLVEELGARVAEAERRLELADGIHEAVELRVGALEVSVRMALCIHTLTGCTISRGGGLRWHQGSALMKCGHRNVLRRAKGRSMNLLLWPPPLRLLQKRPYPWASNRASRCGSKGGIENLLIEGSCV